MKKESPLQDRPPKIKWVKKANMFLKVEFVGGKQKHTWFSEEKKVWIKLIIYNLRVDIAISATMITRQKIMRVQEHH